LDPWRRELLERVGFNWKGERRSRLTKHQLSEEELAIWQKQLKRLSRFVKGKPEQVILFMQLDDDLFDWAMKQWSLLRSTRKEIEIYEQFKDVFPSLLKSVPPRFLKRWRHCWKIYQELRPDGKSPGTNEDIPEAEKCRVDRWVQRQRMLKNKGKLADWQITLLDEIGFEWVSQESTLRMHERWYAKMEKLLELQATHGVPLSYEVQSSNGLRSWISRMRKLYADGRLPPEMVKTFKEKGFEFDGRAARAQLLDERWQKQLESLEAFKKEYGHVKVPLNFVDDPYLGAWLQRQRWLMKSGNINKEKGEKLEALGVRGGRVRHGGDQGTVRISPWLIKYRLLEDIAGSQPDGKLPHEMEVEPTLRYWLRRQRRSFTNGRLEPWQLNALRKIGFDPAFVPEFYSYIEAHQLSWKANLERFRSFVEGHGHKCIPTKGAYRNLAIFVQCTRRRWRMGKLDEKKMEDLRNLGFVFESYELPRASWMDQLEKLRAYYAEHGNSAVPRKYPPDQGLAEHVAQMKQQGRKGKLSAEKIRLLDELDFPWSRGRPIPRKKKR
ncbi:MAG: helicase associated domain-containing protein, partial [Puniceicoccales bacterium]